jgi:pimeloyl-ACP methyl ester carboxylesterase
MLRGLASRVACPGVVVSGDRDVIVPPAWRAALARLLGADHAVLSGSRHCPHVTCMAELTGVVEAFVAEHVPAPRLALTVKEIVLTVKEEVAS